ncbi:hypothetical protein D3C84_837970 [compost metagenome]
MPASAISSTWNAPTRAWPRSKPACRNCRPSRCGRKTASRPCWVSVRTSSRSTCVRRTCRPLPRPCRSEIRASCCNAVRTFAVPNANSHRPRHGSVWPRRICSRASASVASLVLPPGVARRSVPRRPMPGHWARASLGRPLIWAACAPVCAAPMPMPKALSPLTSSKSCWPWKNRKTPSAITVNVSSG